MISRFNGGGIFYSKKDKNGGRKIMFMFQEKSLNLDTRYLRNGTINKTLFSTTKSSSYNLIAASNENNSIQLLMPTDKRC